MLGFFLGKQVSWLSNSDGPKRSKRKQAEEPFMRKKLFANGGQHLMTRSQAEPRSWCGLLLALPHRASSEAYIPTFSQHENKHSSEEVQGGQLARVALSLWLVVQGKVTRTSQNNQTNMEAGQTEMKLMTKLNH